MNIGKIIRNSRKFDKLISIPVKTEPKTLKIPVKPEIPVFCCQSGCDKCVWTDYVKDYQKYQKECKEQNIEPDKSEMPPEFLELIDI